MLARVVLTCVYYDGQKRGGLRQHKHRYFCFSPNSLLAAQNQSGDWSSMIRLKLPLRSNFKQQWSVFFSPKYLLQLAISADLS